MVDSRRISDGGFWVYFDWWAQGVFRRGSGRISDGGLWVCLFTPTLWPVHSAVLSLLIGTNVSKITLIL